MLRLLVRWLVTAVGVAAAASAWSAEPIAVVATTTDLRALAEAVGGDRVRVESLLLPGQDPHAVELRPSQIERLKAAALIVRIGLDHERWLTRALRSVRDVRSGGAAPDDRRDLDASRHVSLLQTETPRLREGSAPAHVHAFGNPHYWLDPANARSISADILEALARLAPGERAFFESNRARFIDRLDAGIARWTRAMAPFRGTRVVVAHDSWPYFAARFGLVVVGAVESAPGVPPSPSVLAALPARMRESGVRLLIAEPYSDAAVLRQVAARSGAPLVTLASSVGADPAAHDYIALFDLDIGRLVAALTLR